MAVVELLILQCLLFFFFNDTATTEIYTLSLHDALPISRGSSTPTAGPECPAAGWRTRSEEHTSELQSHSFISYAVFCLKKKQKTITYGLLQTPRLLIDSRITATQP